MKTRDHIAQVAADTRPMHVHVNSHLVELTVGVAEHGELLQVDKARDLAQALLVAADLIERRRSPAAVNDDR